MKTPTPEAAATISARARNTPHNPRQTSSATSALHTTPQTNAHPTPPAPLPQSPPDSRVQKPAIAQSIPPRNPHTSDSARTGKIPPPPVAAEESSAQASPAPSTQNPKCTAKPPQIPPQPESTPTTAGHPTRDAHPEEPNSAHPQTSLARPPLTTTGPHRTARQPRRHNVRRRVGGTALPCPSSVSQSGSSREGLPNLHLQISMRKTSLVWSAAARRRFSVKATRQGSCRIRSPNEMRTSVLRVCVFASRLFGPGTPHSARAAILQPSRFGNLQPIASCSQRSLPSLLFTVTYKIT